jgi:hypothetical protein
MAFPAFAALLRGLLRLLSCANANALHKTTMISGANQSKIMDGSIRVFLKGMEQNRRRFSGRARPHLEHRF